VTGPEFAIGSRGSALALAQAKLVREALQQKGHATRVVIIETEGDRRSRDTAWGEGAFVAAIERALMECTIDVAVHSAKDVPTVEDPRLRIGAYLPRADARDALVVRTGAAERCLADLPPGSRVGTDSPRRTGFLLARRPDLIVQPLHGNVDTRLRRLDEGETDALLVACAGLDRMGLGDRIAERLDPEIVPPAPGQGAIAIQVRSDDRRMVTVATAIDHRPTRQAVEAERTFLRASGGGCRSPIGALATIVGDDIDLLGGYARPDGTRIAIVRRQGPVESGDDLGHALAVELDPGVRVRSTTGHVGAEDRRSGAPRVLVPRAAEQADELVSALHDEGLDPIPVPAIAIELAPLGGLEVVARVLGTYAWVVITSANGARAVARHVPTVLATTKFAAIGSATRRVLEREGIDVEFQPSESSGIALAVELPVVAGDRIVIVRGDLAEEELAIALRARGAEVDDVIAYRTREAPESSRAPLRRAVSEGPLAAVAMTSGSTVRGLVALGRAESVDVLSIPSVCIGPETAEAARAAGFQILAISPTPDSAALAATIARALVLQPQELS
jgi:hydroxymethylbilane synthase